MRTVLWPHSTARSVREQMPALRAVHRHRAANRIMIVTLLIWSALTAAIFLEVVLGRPVLPV